MDCHVAALLAMTITSKPKKLPQKPNRLISRAAPISVTPMLSRLKHTILLLYRAGDNLVDNYGLEVAGYLTFLALLALFPYLVLMVSAAGVIGQGEAGREAIGFVLKNLPTDAVAALQPRIDEILSGPPQSLLTFAILGAIWTASSAVEAVRGVLNRAYRVRKPPAYLARRLLSIAQIFILTFILLAVTLIAVLAPLVLNYFSSLTGITIPLALDHFFTTSFRYIAIAVLFGVVATLYYVLPNIKQSFLAVAPGAALVVALWVGAASVVSFYINDIGNVSLIYGSLSGFIATLIFFYVMNLIFIYGAEFNHELMVLLGHRIIEREKGEAEVNPLA
jgi:membrane protein